MATKQRGNGEGSISQRTDGRWMARLTLPAGKRKYFYGETRADVAKTLAAALRAQQQGVLVAPEKQTLGEFLAVWLADIVKPKVRPSSWVRYRELALLHVVPELGRTPLAKLTPQQVQALLNRKAASLAPRTVCHIRAVLRQALNQAVRWQLVARNVAMLVDPPRVPRQEMAALSPAQARRLLDATKGDRLEALYSVALALGLRQGEALGLRWKDVDLDGRVLRVQVALQRIDGDLTFVEPKSSTSRRTVQLPESIVQALRQHRVRQIQERLFMGERWHEGGLVFTSSIGTPPDSRNVLRYFRQMLQRAGLPRMRFHDLRHSCASLLLAQHVPARVVMELLGHSQISLTLNTYSHVMPAMAREAADQMDAILQGRA